MGNSETTTTLAYRVRINRRARSARISVASDGEVQVLLPRPQSDRAVRQLLLRHQDWIDARLAEWQQEQARLPAALGLQPDAVHLRAVAESWPVSYGVTLARGQWRENETPRSLALCAAAHEPPAREALQDWLQSRARRLLPPWLESLAQKLGLQVAGVTIRAQRTRWGSCSSLGRINLNRNLLFLPSELVEYLLVHELCHLHEPNHSSRFWQRVGSVLPDFRERDRALRGASAGIPMWARPRP